MQIRSKRREIEGESGAIGERERQIGGEGEKERGRKGGR